MVESCEFCKIGEMLRHETSVLAYEMRCSNNCGHSYLEPNPDEKRMCEEILRLREALKIARETLETFCSLPNLYKYPENWRCAEMGGTPEAEDFEKVDVDVDAEIALKKIDEALKK